MPAWTEQTAKVQLEKDRKIAKLGQVGKRIKGTTGRCTLAVDQETYIRTVEQNGGVQPGGKTIFDDREFVNDMKRKHDHLRLPGERPHGMVLGRPSRRVQIKGNTIIETDCRTGEVITRPFRKKKLLWAKDV